MSCCNMKWIPIKIYQSKQLEKEVDNISKIYLDQLSKAKQTKHSYDIDQLNSLRNKIKMRIYELNNFCSQNINDNRIGIFEKIKTKLESLITLTKVPSISKETPNQPLVTLSSPTLINIINSTQSTPWNEAIINIKLTQHEYNTLLNENYKQD